MQRGSCKRSLDTSSGSSSISANSSMNMSINKTLEEELKMKEKSKTGDDIFSTACHITSEFSNTTDGDETDGSGDLGCFDSSSSTSSVLMPTEINVTKDILHESGEVRKSHSVDSSQSKPTKEMTRKKVFLKTTPALQNEQIILHQLNQSQQSKKEAGKKKLQHAKKKIKLKRDVNSKNDVDVNSRIDHESVTLNFDLRNDLDDHKSITHESVQENVKEKNPEIDKKMILMMLIISVILRVRLFKI